MLRANAVASIAATFCVLGTSCQSITGSVDVITPPSGPVAAPGPMSSGQMPSTGDRVPPPGFGAPPAVDATFPPGAPPLMDSGDAAVDAGAAPPDAGPPPRPPAPRPVLVASAASELERVGEEGGEPHLGVCEGGVVIGIRPTANPSAAIFGERVTFVEPICGRLMLEPGSGDDPASVRVVPDDAILTWPESETFSGPPVTEVPDPRLVWIVQPPTLCPESAPVVVGLAGEYDPTAPDSTVTAAIRSVAVECAPLVVGADGVAVVASPLGRQVVEREDSFAAEGAAEYASSCAEGAVTTQLLLHAGFWLDGFVLGCSSLASPHLPGEPCAGDEECQSGACGDDGRCEP